MSVVRATVRQSVVRVSQQAAENAPAIVRVTTRSGTVVRASLGTFKPLSELFVTLQFSFNGGGVQVLGGQFVDANDVPFPCRIIGWTITTDLNTTAQLMVDRSNFADFPVFDDIAGFDPINVANVSKASGDIPGRPLIYAGDILRATVISNSAAKTISLGLRIARLSL